MTVPRSKGRPRHDQAGAIEAAIRDAAMAVLVEQGDGATVQAVAESAGLSRKTLYARYPSRRHLFGAIVRDLLQSTQPLQFALGATATANLASFITAALAAMVRPDALAVQRLLAADLKGDADLREDLIQASRRMFVAPLEALLRDGVARGEFAIADPCWTTAAILRLTVSEVIASHDYAGILNVGDGGTGLGAAERIVQLVLRGITANTGPRQA